MKSEIIWKKSETLLPILLNESVTEFNYTTGFKSANTDNQHHLGVIHPIWGYEYGYYSEQHSDGLSITENEGYIYDEIDGYESSKSLKFSVNDSESGVYETVFKNKDFSKLPPSKVNEPLLAYENYQISPIYNQGVNYLEETGKYIDFTINEMKRLQVWLYQEYLQRKQRVIFIIKMELK